MKKITCLRCGQCCFLNDGKACNFLAMKCTGINPKTFCMIYQHRIGTILRTGEVCRQRDPKVQGNFGGCPYNA